MKIKRLFIFLGVVMLVSLMVAGVASAKTTRTYFTGTETFISGEDPLRYWEAGKTAHIRGATTVYLEEATIPEVSGTNTTTMNMNVHPASGGGYEIQFWGTFRNENLDGYWVGTFQGKVSTDGSVQYDARGDGGGNYQGLMEFLHAENGTYSGYILDPGQ